MTAGAGAITHRPPNPSPPRPPRRLLALPPNPAYLASYGFVNELKMRQATTSFTDYEMVSLVEPHKWNQNSCTLIRKVSEYNAEENIVRGRA